MSARGAKASAMAAVFALAIGTYLPTIRYGFTGWDDTAYVTENPHVTSAGAFSRIWTSADSDVYYPLTYSSYWLEYRLWGAHPAGYHATNAVLHGVNAVLLVAFLLALGTTMRAAALSGALFAVHPLGVMTVAWIAERKNLLALLFTLLTLVAWVRAEDGRRGRRLRVLAFAAFVAAVASKTAALGLPLALVAYDVFVTRRRVRSSLARVAPMLAVGLAAVFVTVAFERPFVGRGGSVLIPGLLLRVQIAGAAPWFYAGKLLLPIGLSPAYPLWKVDATRFVWWLPFLATLVTSVVFVLAMRRVQNARTRCIAWLATLAAILLAPSLGVVAFANLAVTFVSDHFLYLPSAGIFGVIGMALDAGRGRRAVDVAAIAACVACTVGAVAYEPTFRDAESMWSRVVERAPDSYAGNLGVAEAWARSGRVVEAESRFEKAIAIAPEATDGYLLWGRTKNEHGDAAGAAALFSRALELSPESVPAMLGLARASEQLGEIPKALTLYERAARSDPRDVSARMGLGAMYLGYARPDDALREFRAAIDLVPANPRGYLGAATCLRSLARYGEAVAMLRAGLERSPGDVGLLNLAALTLATAPDDRVRNGDGAIAFAERASALAPGNGELHATLAAAYAEAGRFDDAARESSRAEAAASDAHDEKGTIEQRRRSALYMRGEALRLGR